MISAFMLLTLLILTTGCDNEGIVGEELNPTGDRVVTTSYDVDSIEIIHENGFSGRLNNSAMGIVEDPVYGSVKSSTLLKPSINVEDFDELPDDYNVKLTLELNSLKYGTENSISDYNIYEVNQRWRGREITYNQPISFDDSNLLGSFQLSDETEIEVDLDQEWISRYREFFNSSSSQRDSLYRFEFPGIAVVPADHNQKIDFLRHQLSSNDTTETQFTRFVVENEDSLITNIPLLDFGTSMERTDIPETEGLVLHNTLENILKVDFGIDATEFENKEIVNAQLVFTIDPFPQESAPGGFLRPQPELIRAHFFESEPLDIASEIFARGASVGANLSENEEQFRVNVTGYFVDKLFGEIDTTPLYFSIQRNNGLFYSTTLYGEDAPENLRPRLIVTTINPEN